MIIPKVPLKKPRLRTKFVSNVDKLLQYAGECSLYQVLLLLISSGLVIPVTFQLVISFFVAANPPWRCTANSTFCTTTDSYGKGHDNYTLRCSLGRVDWQYVQKPSYSIVTEFGLYCENEDFIFVSHSALFAGSAVGALLFSWLADKYGRKKIMIPCYFLTLVLPFASSFSPNFWVFVGSRFLCGITSGALLPLLFTLCIESLSPRYRPAAGLLWIFHAVALLVVGSVAMAVGDWRKLMIYSTAPYAVLLPFIFFLPESVRWLHFHGKNEMVNKHIQWMAKINARKHVDIKVMPIKIKDSTISIWLLFANTKMVLTSLTVGFAWLVNSLVYASVSMAIGDLSGHFYHNYLLSGSVELPAALLAILCSVFLGRKKTVIGALSLGGLFFAVVSALDEAQKHDNQHMRYLRPAFGLIGKFFVTLSYDALFTWTVELYPTQIRAEALAYATITARIGDMISPWLAAWLHKFHWRVPFAAMGILGVVAALSLAWLPETRGIPTLERMDDLPRLERYLREKKLRRSHRNNNTDQEMSLVSSEFRPATVSYRRN